MSDPKKSAWLYSTLRFLVAMAVGKVVQLAIHYGILPEGWSADLTTFIDQAAQYGVAAAYYAIAKLIEKYPGWAGLLLFRNPEMPPLPPKRPCPPGPRWGPRPLWETGTAAPATVPVF